ncbi:MAG TPA: phenylalanine--tRNA ligase subunit beta [Candidatus Paceibacterota bacterium]|nr:phenylalanine--tRNA ligase subunit beta [Candidatus Paceibacterota bacterium]
MLFSYSWLQQYTKDKLPTPERCAELLNMHAFEVETVEKKGKDTVLDIDVLPNRAHDCLSHVGMARELATISGKKLALPRAKDLQKQKGSLPQLSVQVQSSQLVPRYTALVIEGVQIQPSPKWLKERLQALGVNSINNVVDLTNYIMLEIGQPLHAFDYDQIQKHKMLVRASGETEKVQTLDDQTLTLPKGTLVIEDGQGLIDLAGIKGGQRSSISAQTKNIVLQAANFEAATIYKTKKRLKYSTQAADIYAHGIDPNLTTEALGRALYLLAEWKIGGKVVQVIDLYPKKVVPATIRLHHAHLESVLGIAVPAKKVQSLLSQLGCQIREMPKQRFMVWEVKPPTRRMDLQISEDLIEEIGRLYGFAKIPSSPPLVALSSPQKNQEIAWRERVRDAFSSQGFYETYTYSLIGVNDLAAFRYSEQEKARLVALQNPTSADFAYMRDSLLENLVKNVMLNEKKFSQIRLFEIGKVFSKDSRQLKETLMLGAVLAGESFYSAKGVIDFLFESLGISGVWYDDYKATPEKSRPILWQNGKSAEIKVGSEEIGFVGEISFGISLNLKISKPVVAIHIHMEKLVQLATEETEYLPVSKFPAVVRDIAVLVPPATKVAELMNTITATGQSLIRDIDLFDMYEGEKEAGGKKSLAFHLVYQSDNKTLENKEVDTLHNNIIKQIEKNPLWQVRN